MPPPLMTFEATGFPPEILREVSSTWTAINFSVLGDR